MMSGGVQCVVFGEFQHVEIWKICFKDVPIFLLFFELFLVINTGCGGPDLVNILEVKMIQKVLQYVQEP